MEENGEVTSEVPNRLIKTVRHRKMQPTLKQIKALQNYNQGMSISKAMRMAGYSKNTSSVIGRKFFKMQGAQTAIASIMSALENYGVTVDTIARKIAEFVDAEKIDHSHTEPDRKVPDYKTQVEGVKLLREIVKEQLPEGQVKKREMTITEYVNGIEDAR